MREEIMTAHFTKYHLAEWIALHHFNGTDLGEPHDHPMSMDIRVLAGGYVERVYQVDGSYQDVERLPGTSHAIAATHIHQIIALPAGDCWTFVEYGIWEREPRFWRFGAQAESRAWNEAEYAPLATCPEQMAA